MSIFANQSEGAIEVGITDTPILEPDLSRYGVTAAILMNRAAAARTVEIYESPNLTSASGELIASLVLDALEAIPVEEIVGQSYFEGQNLIALAVNGSGGDVICRITFTSYTGAS